MKNLDSTGSASISWKRNSYLLPLIFTASCVVCWIVGLLFTSLTGVMLRLTPGTTIFLWPHPLLTISFAIWAMLLMAAGWLTCRRVRRLPHEGRPWLYSTLFVFEPLVFLPLSIYPLLLRPRIPPMVVGNTVFFVPLIISSAVITRALTNWGEKLDQHKLGWRAFVVATAVGTIFFSLSGVYFTRTIGPHSGDEGHYIIQAESLYYDHDLDLANNLPRPNRLTPKYLLHHHISPLSRNGRAYSWHPFGLSLLLAPTIPDGVIARHLVLGLISGLGCGGMLVFARLISARTSSTLVITTLFALSNFWGIYSSRALPEVLGATLLLWLTISIFLQATHPLAASILGGICCAYSPWAHVRFIPPGLVGATTYTLTCLLSQRRLRNRIIRLTPFLAICAGSGMLYFYTQRRMFHGGSGYAPAAARIFSEPLGPWHVLASNAGVLHPLPLFAWLLAASILAAILDRKRRMMSCHVLASLGAVLITSCTTTWYTGGASLSGRFLFAVVPLTLGPAALMFDRAGERARRWFVFLGLISCAQFLVILVRLPIVGKFFTSPLDNLRTAIGPLDGLLQPFRAPDQSVWHPFALVLFASTSLLMLPASCCGLSPRGRRLADLMLICLVAAAAVLCSAPPFAGRFRTNPVRNAQKLSGLDVEKGLIRFVSSTNSIPLFSISNLFADYRPPSGLTLTIDEPPAAGMRKPLLVPNDWSGQPLVWSNIVPEFAAGRGLRLCRVRALIEGEARAIFAIREGKQILIEEAVEPTDEGMLVRCWKLRCTGQGLINLLVRLEGARGNMKIQSLEWSPIIEPLVDSGLLVLPTDCYTTR